ncbi:hypothetical protein ACFYRL_03960 [Streptomyces goshikiensis]|uniref:hypothetical protein n=1 Tax=Streptomyces goshikiensis TaxID=1942 RepID=UPI0036952E8A
MSRQVVLKQENNGRIHGEAPIAQICVQSVLDKWQTNELSDPPAVRTALFMALDGNNADFEMLTEAIVHGVGDITLDGSTGYARLA